MSFAIFGIAATKTPAVGQGLVWDGMKYEPGTTSGAASALTGLTLNRVPFGTSGGGLQDSSNLTFNGTTLTLTGAMSVSGQLTVGSGSGDALAVIAGGTGQNRFVRIYTGVGSTTANLRWDIGANGVAESGSNAGSPFQVNAYSDTGGYIDTPLNIDRVAGGTATFARPVSLSSTLAVTGTSTLAAVNASGKIASTTASIAASFTTNDAGTVNQPSIFTINHTTSGVPAAGFGCDFDFNAHTDTNTLQAQASIVTQWATATNASRKGRVVFYAVDTGFREFLRGEASGSAPMIGFLGASAVTRPNVTGSKGANAALTSLMTALANLGLVTDSTT